MDGIPTEYLLIILCAVVVLSYFFSIISRYVKVPSVLLLLFAGVGLRALANASDLAFALPLTLVEGLGVVGLIMIVLEAGLDLQIEKNKLGLIRRAFVTALVILVLSAAILTLLLYVWFKEDITRCIVYALPLSIMSSSIVLPSIHHLTETKKEFLFTKLLFPIYSAFFSSIIFQRKKSLCSNKQGLFSLNLVMAVALSFFLSFLLFYLLVKTTLNVKFFLIFALLILIYSCGKLLHLPSLLIILVFGLLIGNWEKVSSLRLQRFFPLQQVHGIRSLLHSITAERLVSYPHVLFYSVWLQHPSFIFARRTSSVGRVANGACAFCGAVALPAVFV